MDGATPHIRAPELDPLSLGTQFAQRRLGATLHACRTLRHEYATPFSAAFLHLERTRRAVARWEGARPGDLLEGLEACRRQLEESSRLLDGLSAVSDARQGEPALVDLAALVASSLAAARPELERRGLETRFEAPTETIRVLGFADELEDAVRHALLAVSRWAASGQAFIETGTPSGTASFSFQVPLAGEPPGDDLFRSRGRNGKDFGTFLARWTFESHGGSFVCVAADRTLTLTGTLPLAAR